MEDTAHNGGMMANNLEAKKQLAREYEAQRAAMMSHFATTKQDYFVAEAVLAGSPQGDVITYATLTDGVQTLLPVVDFIVLVTLDGAMSRLPFARLAEIDALLTPVENTQPPMVFATRFPSELLSS